MPCLVFNIDIESLLRNNTGVVKHYTHILGAHDDPHQTNHPPEKSPPVGAAIREPGEFPDAGPSSHPSRPVAHGAFVRGGPEIGQAADSVGVEALFPVAGREVADPGEVDVRAFGRSSGRLGGQDDYPGSSRKADGSRRGSGFVDGEVVQGGALGDDSG